MRNLLLPLFLFLLPLSRAASTAADELTASEVVERVKDANEKVSSWSAQFLQRKHFVHFNETETRSGKIAFKRGTGVRVDLTEPEQETIVVREKKALQWLPRSAQLHVFVLDGFTGDLSPIPFRFGDGSWDPAKTHTIRLVDAAVGEVALELTPRDPGSTYVRKTIWLDEKSWLPVRVQLVESTDDTVNFVFSDVAVDQPIPDDVLELNPPANAEIIEHKDLPTF